MKHSLLLIFAGVVAVTAVAAELVITSFNQNGELSWTNTTVISASYPNPEAGHASYRVEWAGSSAGPWNKFDALTNLTQLSTTTNSVTVKVPTFYRVIWTDPPNPIGVWEYRGYDSAGGLVITGQLNLVNATSPVTGSWKLAYAGPPTNDLSNLGPQIGTGTLRGTFDFADAYLQLGLGPSNVLDNNVTFFGTVWGNTYTGRWEYYGFFPINRGTFNALRQPDAQNRLQE